MFAQARHSKTVGFRTPQRPRVSLVHADAIDNWDLSAINHTRIKENIELEFRGEFINALNHVTFSAPNTNPASTAFGTVTSE